MSEQEYTPTTDEVRAAYGDMHCEDMDGDHSNGCPQDRDFDRWLAQVRREATLAERERFADVVKYATGVMAHLEEFGPSIVPHLMDTDDNDGQFLREALDALAAQDEGDKTDV